MCAPIPKGKWAWKYEKCLSCETTKIKHKGRGLCARCNDKERAKNPKRKEQLKNQHDRWYSRVKGTKEYKKYSRERVKIWQDKINPRAHRRNWQKRNLKKSFKNFLTLDYPAKTKKGLTINIDGKMIKTNILPKNTINSEKSDLIYRINLFKQVYREIINQ